MRKLRPYLDADRGYPMGYKSCKWAEDDRRAAIILKAIVSGTCITVALLLSYVLE